MSVIERIRQRCIKGDGDCWLWTGATSGGVPSIWRDGSCGSARRAVYQEATGASVPHGVPVVMTCGEQACLNPKHMREGSFSEVQRRIAQSADVRVRLAAAGRKGGRMSAKLDEEKAAYIRASDRPAIELAREFGVDASLIHYVRRGKAWKAANPFAGLIR